MEKRDSHSLAFWRTLFLTGIWMCFAVASAVAQVTPSPDATQALTGNSSGPQKVAFEVVSIRPNGKGNRMSLIGIPRGGGEFHALGMPLATTILFAYFPGPLQSKGRLSGAPSWVWKDSYDFVGKVGEADLPEWHELIQHGLGQPNSMLEAMLQAALADRCKLVAHRIPATVPGFALVLASHGPNAKTFVAAKPDEIVPDNAQRIVEEGRMVPILSRDEPVTHFYETSTVSLAAMMSRWGAPVEDRTGLTGEYDFALTRLSTIGDPSVDWDVAALGLKLEPIKVPTETIVIDHIERPSAN